MGNKGSTDPSQVPLAHRIGAMTRYFARTERLRGKFLAAGQWLINAWGPDFESKIQATIVKDIREGIYRNDPRWVNSAEAWQDLQLYHEQWLASLFVVVEGYRKLIAIEKDFRDSALLPLIHHRLAKELEEFRNVVYHFDAAYYDLQNRIRLRSPDELKWLGELQDALHEFFDSRVRKFYKENGFPDPMDHYNPSSDREAGTDAS